MKQEMTISYGQPGEWQASQMAIQTAEKSTDTHYSKRLTGAASIFATVGLAIPLLAACGSSAGTAPSNRPSIQPTHQPSTTIMVEPSAMPSQSIKVEVTPPPTEAPTPSPEATPTPKPLTLESWFKAKHPAVSAEAMQTSVNNAVDNNPDALVNPVYNTSGQLRSDLSVCGGGPNPAHHTGTMAYADRTAACQGIALITWVTYEKSGDPTYLTAFKNIYNYAISPNGLGPSYKVYLDNYLKGSS